MAPWIAVTVSLIAVVVIPSFALNWRMAVRWTRVESKLEQVVENMEHLVQDKDRVHLAIQTEIKDDRRATNLRLRWLEENLWKKGGGESDQRTR